MCTVCVLQVQALPACMSKMALLQRLDLSGCESLRELPSWPRGEDGRIAALNWIGLVDCDSLPALPRLPGVSATLVVDDAIAPMALASEAYRPGQDGYPALHERTIPLCELCNRLSATRSLYLRSFSAWACTLRQLEVLKVDEVKGSVPTSVRTMGLAGQLKVLVMCYCMRLVALPDAFGSLYSLQRLDLRGCVRLDGEKIPHSFGNLISLQELDMRGCLQLRKLPEAFGQLAALRVLQIGSYREFATNLTREARFREETEHPDSDGSGYTAGVAPEYAGGLQELPRSFCRLHQLKFLNLRGCVQLAELSDPLPPNLAMLVVHQCSRLVSLPHPLPSGLEVIDMAECTSLESFPVSLLRLRRLAACNLLRCGLVKHQQREPTWQDRRFHDYVKQLQQRGVQLHLVDRDGDFAPPCDARSFSNVARTLGQAQPRQPPVNAVNVEQWL